MTSSPNAPQGAGAPDITVIVPAYNAQRFLGDTLDSLLTQRGVAFEVHVVDDRSTDGTPALVKGYAERDPRVRYSVTPANFGGPAGPRNLGVAGAQTEWVAFCDADDLWHPDKLRTQLDVARTHGATIVCTGLEAFQDGVKPMSLQAPLGTPRTREISLLQMLLKNRVATSSVLCRRDQLQKTDGFNTDRGMIAVEDYDMWMRLMTQFGARVIRIDQALIAYRHLSTSLSSAKWRQALKILRVHQSIFAAKGWSLLFPLAAPFLMAYYISSWLYLRSHIRRA